MQPKKRQAYLDALRIVAIMCVIFNHSGVRGFFLYTQTDNLLIQVISIFVSSFCKIGVPLFFMISGALLIDKEESLKDLYLKRVLRFVIILFVFSFMRYFYFYRHGHYQFAINEFVRMLSTNQIYMPYWFLYTYLAFLICLPFIRRLAHSLKDSEFIYLFILYVVTGGIFGILARTVIGQIALSIPVTADIIMYPLLGYFITNRLPKEKDTVVNWLLLFMMSVIGLFINVFITEYDYHAFGGWNESGLSLFIIFPAAATFWGAKMLFEKVKINAALEKFICTLGSCTFGVYLLEGYVKDYFGFIQAYMALVIPGSIASLLYLFCILFIGAAITYVLKKIPVIRKLL